MIQRTKQSAVSTLKKFFSNKPEDDVVSLDEVFMAWERNPDDLKGNMLWLYNKIGTLKYHNLIKSVYTVRNERRVLQGVQLTMQGKKALGRIEGSSEYDDELSVQNAPTSALDIKTVFKLVSQFKKENPDYEVIFEARLKSI